MSQYLPGNYDWKETPVPLAELQRLDRLASGLEQASVTGEGATGADGLQILAHPPRTAFWARIADRVAGSEYDFVEVQDDGTGATGVTWADVEGGLTGTAFEVNANTDVADGTVVWVVQSEANERWEFLYPGTTGGSGSLEVKEADGNPDVSGVTVLVVDQATGLAVESHMGGTVTLQLLAASATQEGAVTTGAQTFAGLKSFQDNIKLPSDPGEIDFFKGTAGAVASISVTTATLGGITDANALTLFASSGGSWLTLWYDGTDAILDVSAPLGPGVGCFGVDYVAGLGKKGLTASIGYNKSGGGTGTLTFSGGILTGST